METRSLEVATFAGGCFWCTEAAFRRMEGVVKVTPGYMGGSLDNPTYAEVKAGTSGHAEVVQVEFDTAVTSYAKLLDWFFRVHDPTTVDRQGQDEGTQYRSVVFFHTPKQQAQANRAKAASQAKFEEEIVTQVVPASDFYVAEEEHQFFFERNPEHPDSVEVIAPKLRKVGL